MEPDKKIKPQPDTDFGNEQFDSTPIKSGYFSGFNEKIFSLMRPKKSGRSNATPTVWKSQIVQTESSQNQIPISNQNPIIPDGHEIQNGLLITKKSLAETVRDQLRYPVIKNIPAMTSGLALIIFAVGAYLLYSALPTRPDLILGIILVSVAGNILMNR